MGNPDNQSALNLQEAIDEHVEAMKDGGEKIAGLEEALKLYAKHQQKTDSVYTAGNWIRGFYYLTFARWFDYPKYVLAHKALKWCREEVPVN